MSNETPNQPTTQPSENKQYVCECCNYSTYTKYCYEKHILSNKHKKREQNIPSIYKCDLCDAEYKIRQSLYKHRKTCTGSLQPTIPDSEQNITIEIETTPVPEYIPPTISVQENNFAVSYNNTIMNSILEKLENIEEIIEKRVEEKIQELKKESQPNVRGPYNIIQKDKVLDFLNTYCMDAPNLYDILPNKKFTDEELDNIKLGIFSPKMRTFFQNHYNKLEYFINESFHQSMLKIFDDCFGHLSIYERPIHCINARLKIFYIKENGQWIKLEDTKKIRYIIEYFSDICHISLLKYDYDNLEPFSPSRICYEKLTKEQNSYIEILRSNAYAGYKSLYDSYRISNNESKINPLITMIGNKFYLGKDILNGM